MKTASPKKPAPPVSVDEDDFGMRLQQIRKRRGLSQVEVAQRLGIHQSLISQYERGYLRLHGALIVKFAEVFGCTPDEILGVKHAEANEADHTLDRRFLRRLQKLHKLSPHDKKILLGTIDAFLAKTRTQVDQNSAA